MRKSEFRWSDYFRNSTLATVGGNWIASTIAEFSPSTMRLIGESVTPVGMIFTPVALNLTVGLLKTLAVMRFYPDGVSEEGTHSTANRDLVIKWLGALTMTLGADAVASIVTASGQEEAGQLMATILSTNAGPVAKVATGYGIGLFVTKLLGPRSDEEQKLLSDNENTDEMDDYSTTENAV